MRKTLLCGIALSGSAALIGLGAAPSPAQPAGSGNLPGLPCVTEEHLRSTVGEDATSIHFENASAQTVNLYWLNYSGERVLYNVLAPGDSRDRPTYLTHPWVVTDSEGNCLAVYRSRGTPSTVTFTGPVGDGGP